MSEVQTETKTVDAVDAIAAAAAAAQANVEAAGVEAAASAGSAAGVAASGVSAGAGAPDVAAQLSALQAKIDALTATRSTEIAATPDGAADPLAALTAQVAQQSAAFAAADGERLKAARDDAFDRLGIDDAYRDVIPPYDPRTAQGRRDLEVWIAARPAIARSRAPKPPQIDANGFGGNVADILAGKRTSTLVSADSISRMLRGEQR